MTLEIAIMIPMTDKHARLASSLRPAEWEATGVWTWPESVRLGGRDVPMFPGEIANEVQAGIEAEIARGVTRWVIVTRSEMVFLRIARMIAEGAPITAAVHLVDATGQERIGITPDGRPEKMLHVFQAPVDEGLARRKALMARNSKEAT